MRRRFRLLPIVIFFGALTLTFKLGSIWQDMPIIDSSPALAATETKDVAKEAAGKKADPKMKPAKAGKKTTSNDGAAKRGVNFDPTKVTDAEMDVLEKLAARRAALEQRRRDLDLRETLLRATETRIDGKIGELKKIKKTIEALLKRHDAQEEAKMKSLVKIYESMKPKDAARIFEQLDLPVLLNVVERMREARTAPILAKMSAGKAKRVTAALAARRTLPRVSQNKSQPKKNRQ